MLMFFKLDFNKIELQVELKFYAYFGKFYAYSATYFFFNLSVIQLLMMGST